MCLINIILFHQENSFEIKSLFFLQGIPAETDSANLLMQMHWTWVWTPAGLTVQKGNNVWNIMGLVRTLWPMSWSLSTAETTAGRNPRCDMHSSGRGFPHTQQVSWTTNVNVITCVSAMWLRTDWLRMESETTFSPLWEYLGSKKQICSFSSFYIKKMCFW